jgi:MGT family glycosyltransferase
VLHATDNVFDFSFQPRPRNHYVGPLGTWEPSAEAPSYLSEPGDPWVLISISSQLQDDLPIADAAIAAFADRPVRVLVTVGPDHDPGELSSVPSNVRVEHTVSHAAVLDQAILFVSHAGHGSVMKALWKGRPMVLVPWGRDQPGVAARASALGVAVVVPRDEASPQSIRSAIDNVLSSSDAADAAARHAARLQSTDPPGAAATLLETLL